MQENAFEQLLQSIGHSHWPALWIVFLMTLESAPVIGLLIPGVFVMVGLGSLSSTDYLSFADCVIFAVAGALVGDSIGYWAGYFGHAERLRNMGLQRYGHSWNGAEALLERHGRLAVFFGRFIWFLHPTVPPIAGAGGLRPGWFYLADVPAVSFWVLLYASIGHWATGAARAWTLEFFTALGVLIALVLLYFLARHLGSRN